jgi:hypothetical protein
MADSLVEYDITTKHEGRGRASLHPISRLLRTWSSHKTADVVQSARNSEKQRERADSEQQTELDTSIGTYYPSMPVIFNSLNNKFTMDLESKTSAYDHLQNPSPLCPKCKERRLQPEDQYKNKAWKRRCMVCSGKCKSVNYPSHLIVAKSKSAVQQALTIVPLGQNALPAKKLSSNPASTTTQHETETMQEVGADEGQLKRRCMIEDKYSEPINKKAKRQSVKKARPTIASGGVSPPCDNCINQWWTTLKSWKNDTQVHNASQQKTMCQVDHSDHKSFEIWRRWLGSLTRHREALLIHSWMMTGLTQIDSPIVLQDLGNAHGSIDWTNLNEKIRDVTSIDRIFEGFEMLKDVWTAKLGPKYKTISIICLITVSLNDHALTYNLPCKSKLCCAFCRECIMAD